MKVKQITILSLAIVGMLTFFLTEHLTDQSSEFCKIVGEYYYQTTCQLVGDITLITFPLFVLSLLFLFFNKETIFVYWRKFTFIYIFIYLFISIITPWYAGDGFFNIQKEITIVALCVLYFIISIFLIIYKSRK